MLFSKHEVVKVADIPLPLIHPSLGFGVEAAILPLPAVVLDYRSFER